MTRSAGSAAGGTRPGYAGFAGCAGCARCAGFVEFVRAGVGPAAVVPGSVGLMGGTFDPIHVGHLAIAETAREQLGLERVDFVPAGQPMLRSAPPSASPEHRAAMVELAIAGNPRFGLDRIEVDRAEPSYAMDTLSAMHARDRVAGRPPDYWFILSTQTLLTLPRWKDPERLMGLVRFGVVPRAGSPGVSRAWLDEQIAGLADRVRLLDGPLLAISATAIREHIRGGWSVRYLVPEAVRAYINDHHLYRS